MENACIFYIDDDQDDIGIFCDCATRLGHRTVATSAADALFKSLKYPPPKADIVLVDLNMPSVDGIEIIERIRANPEWNSLPVIVHSTANDNHSIVRCRTAGATMYVRKPDTYSGLSRIINYLVNTDWATFQPQSHNFYFSAEQRRELNI